MKSLSQKSMVSLLKPILSVAPQYQKVGKIEARQAQEGEIIVTMTQDGKETENQAKKGDFVVANPGGERYIISAEKMDKRYQEQPHELAQLGPLFKVYTATGTCYGVIVDDSILLHLGIPPGTLDFTFEPSWGGKMRCRLGDMLVTTHRDVPEVYRIAKAEFEQTYRPIFF